MRTTITVGDKQAIRRAHDEGYSSAVLSGIGVVPFYEDYDHQGPYLVAELPIPLSDGGTTPLVVDV